MQIIMVTLLMWKGKKEMELYLQNTRTFQFFQSLICFFFFYSYLFFNNSLNWAKMTSAVISASHIDMNWPIKIWSQTVQEENFWEFGLDSSRHNSFKQIKSVYRVTNHHFLPASLDFEPRRSLWDSLIVVFFFFFF